MDITHDLHEIEGRVGRLSPVQKLLLVTDGSVTQLLETVTGNVVAVETDVQEIVGADTATAERLGVREGDPVNHRVVDLKETGTGHVLVHAISETPISRLPTEFRDDLMKADIPIGRIISHHRLEARREILNARVADAGSEGSRIFSILRSEPLLCRQYRIIHNAEPLIFIEEQFPYNMFLDERRVIVETPSRIHLTLIDMHGGSGRVDGGVGIALGEPGIHLEAQQSPEFEVKGCDRRTADLVREVAARVLAGIHAGSSASVVVRKTYPFHIGLGSGTQLALATARALCELYGRSLTTQELARMVGRGGTSGIGTAAFIHGGFIIDGGHRFGPACEKSDFRPSSASRGVRPPPVIARHNFPPDWQILLAIPDLPAGASGSAEADIFRRHCPVPVEEVQALSHEILMRMLPGLVECDLDLFGSSINAIQTLGFKRVELSLQPPAVTGLLVVMRSAGAAGAGLSSFGPACYAVCDTGVRETERAARSFMEAGGGGTTIITTARNTGAAVRVA
jgi:beta-ribofuranosylaminobenzene 5'-phosphate synthase